MGLWDKMFGKGDKEEKKDEEVVNESEYNLNWVASNQNPWNIQLLDLRPISQTMLSSSKDPLMATNAISYKQEDGLVFLNQTPKDSNFFESNISFQTDGKLQDGVLFIPSKMESKWAIYFHQNKILFIRSWTRMVTVIANTVQQGNQISIKSIHGEFTQNENNQFTESILKFLIHSHVLKEAVPAPIPLELKKNTDKAGLWAFSTYGNMAHFGHFDDAVQLDQKTKMRTHSLLHIAVARGEVDKIKGELEKGANINSLAADGLSTLQWSISQEISILELLLKQGADPNVKSLEGATPIMNAVQSNKVEHLTKLLEYKAEVNEKDNRGFTALHRAAEMGHAHIVKELLNQGATKGIVAEGHTPISLAMARGNDEIIKMLE